MPIGQVDSQEQVLITKNENAQIETDSLGKVQFVEFKGKYGWQRGAD